MRRRAGFWWEAGAVETLVEYDEVDSVGEGGACSDRCIECIPLQQSGLGNVCIGSTLNGFPTNIVNNEWIVPVDYTDYRQLNEQHIDNL